MENLMFYYNRNLFVSFYNRRFIGNSPIYNYKTYYETLKLKKDCSTTDIRNAYLKLSKQHHPDKNKDGSSHKEFLKISEAYNILSKPLSRRNYDLSLSNPSYNKSTVVYRTQAQGTWSDATFWENRNKSKDSNYKARPYYGIKGINRISNFWIVILCLGFTSVGVLLQILAVRKSFTLRRSDIQKRSDEIEKLHAGLRATALTNGDKKQLELLIERLNKDKRPFPLKFGNSSPAMQSNSIKENLTSQLELELEVEKLELHYE